MGQAWCKEKSTKAQDSKSPLDRVFLRCAHRIYPGLKEEGSVLGGATQRVTSSEIGYAGSPPREALTRGQSIDSVDRPFHPSDWVDVNLEVPVTPRASSAMTNFTLDTTIYPPTTLTSTNFRGTNPMDFAPVPPPRRRRKNRGRPLPPKPDEVTRSHVDRVMSKSSKDSRNMSHEPLYSSVKISKNSSNDKEIFEHKINGTGRIIPSIVVAASRSNRDKSSRESEKNVDEKNFRPKNNSTVSLPNYLELEITDESLLGDQDGDVKIHKITAAGSLPALITSGALENLKKSDNEKKAKKAMEAMGQDEHNNEKMKCSMDEVDFSFDVTKNQDALNSILKLEGPRLTSTPVKSGFENDSRSPTTIGGWFLHQDRAPESDNFATSNSATRHESGKTMFHDCQKDSRSDIFFEAEEDQLDQSEDNRERNERDEKLGDVGARTRTSLKRTLSNESEPFNSCEEKELRERDSTMVRSDSQVKLAGRTISEESLPREMLENETDFFEDKGPIENVCKSKKSDDKSVSVESMKNDDTKTPPPSPEPKIKPEILDNDHSTLLKVLREEAEESNLSSMTPSLTELEAALSDMLEREDDQDIKEDTTSGVIVVKNLPTEKILENPIEPKINHNELAKETNNSVVAVSLKNILVGKEKLISSDEKSSDKVFDDSTMMQFDLTNGDKSEIKNLTKNNLVQASIDNLTPSNAFSGGLPPEKPSRLHHTSHEESLENLGNVPTPPRRRNRYSGYSSSIVTDRSSLERTATPENPYPNDRLI